MTARRNRAEPATNAASPSTLTAVGLRVGDVVRFRRRDGERWREGTVVGREKDGSIGVRDARGASRALPIERLEVRATGPRWWTVWTPVQERATSTEQLDLL